MPYRGAPVPHPQATFPGYPVTPPRSGGGEALVSVLLLLPMLVLIFLGDVLPLLVPDLDVPGRSGWWSAGWGIALGVYFILLVLVRGRSVGRRVGAVFLALPAAVFFSGPSVWHEVTGHYGWPLSNSFTVGRLIAVFVLVVLAWGVARRRSALWLVGLVLTFIVVALWLWARDSVVNSWSPDTDMVLLLIVSYYGAMIAGVLCCWAFDAMGSGGRGRYPVAMTPGMAPGQHPGMAQQMYPQPGSGGFGYPPSGPAPGRGSGYNPMAR